MRMLHAADTVRAGGDTNGRPDSPHGEIVQASCTGGVQVKTTFHLSTPSKSPFVLYRKLYSLRPATRSFDAKENESKKTTGLV
jgi:hypothetical protein